MCGWAPPVPHRKFGDEWPMFYHGGKPGLKVGDVLVPSTPHIEDGCPICEAKKRGMVCTVGEYRRWLMQFGPAAAKVLRALADAPDDAPVDPPAAKQAVYITTDNNYATWYAARSGNGDLYEVAPLTTPERSPEDNFPSFTVESARVVRVIRRNVRLTRTERRVIEHQWKKADRRAERQRAQTDSL